MLEKEIRRIAEIAKKQREGGYTTESDAVVSLVLIQELALAILGEKLPAPVIDPDKPTK